MILDDFSARQSVVARTLSTNHLLETATQDTDSEALVDNSVRLLPAATVSGARDVPGRDRSPLLGEPLPRLAVPLFLRTDFYRPNHGHGLDSPPQSADSIAILLDAAISVPRPITQLAVSSSDAPLASS